MFTIKNIEKELIINKSKFITNLFSVDNIDEVNYYLNSIKNKYKDATHNCYAYIIDNTKRFSDDNEPLGTAGMPILNCLINNKINHVLCVVTRYFGGIKLGSGGLIRAYSNSVSNALKNTEIVKLENGYVVNITFSYNKIDNINKLLDKYEIKEKIFNDMVTYIVNIDKIMLDILKDMTDMKIIKEIIIRKSL